MGVAPQTAQARALARCRAPQDDDEHVSQILLLWLRYGLWRDEAPRAVLMDLPVDVSDVCDLWSKVQSEQRRKQAQRDEQRALLKRMGLMK